MKKFLVALLLAVLFASLISPWIYWGMEWLIARGIFTSLENFPFHRYWSRVTQITAIVFCLPFIFKLGIRRIDDMALKRNPYAWHDLIFGVLATIAVAAILGATYLALGIVEIRHEIAWSKLTKILLTASAVSCLEEVIFRGVLLGLALRVWSDWKSAGIVSFAFAAVHFLKPAKSQTEQVTWLSGFEQVGAIFTHMPSPELLFWGFCTLFFAGMLFAFVRLKTASLWLAIGIHGGWILAQQTFNLITRISSPHLPWGGESLASGVVPTGLLPLLALVSVTAAMMWYLQQRSGAQASSPV